MNQIFKIFACSLIFYLGVASLCFSADTTEANKADVKATSVQKKDIAQQKTTEQKKDSVKQETSEQDKATTKGKAAAEQNKAASKAPVVFFPAPKFEFDQMVDGEEFTHDFVIMNKGTDILQVEKVKTG
ncbi:MAG: hypothetical protein HQK67_04265 [Desulfamplus sp.]|nr:hypothetical protein [Desulfamplus sp.]